jgi:hypothetical protein
MAAGDVDQALLRAWELFLEDLSDDTDAEIEGLLPQLVAAGYVRAGADRWSFTSEGVARAEALERDAEA